MNLKFVFLVGSLSSPLLFAQQLSHPLVVSGGDFVWGNQIRVDSGSGSLRKAAGSQDTLQLLGIMVQFQEDDDERTTGNGTFDQSTTSDRIIDPPPHDRMYFLNHLEFLENYFRKVSNGELILQSDVLPSVITLQKKMEAYSPPRDGPNLPLAELVRDSWTAADSLHPAADFSTYDVFAVFHAGAGRDVDLVNLLGFDPTPLDIPSLFIGEAALKSFFGPEFLGVPVDGGATFISHSMIIPETENRTIPGVSGNQLIQLSINGLLCASLGSYLGLPDLFDTRTGRTAIGRFGLMDGQSIFSFAGLFPPEPSAWERIRLGWVNPITVPPGTTTFSVPAVGFGRTDSTVFRVPVSADEYFLVENRNRDFEGNGQTVTMVVEGATVEKFFSRDTAGFNAFDISEISGVVTDVEDLDWSLPGGVSPAGEFFDGGILIWHVDESVIRANLATNTVNADPNRRGVDLEEADGSQDLGQVYGFLSPGLGSEEGTALDFWFFGNSAPVYRNEFSSTTHPNSLSNSGGNSLVTARDFSRRGPMMTFTVQLGGTSLQPLAGYPRFVGRSNRNYSPQVVSDDITAGAIFFISAGDTIFALQANGASATDDSSGLFSPAGGQFPIAHIERIASPLEDRLVGVQDSSVVFFDARYPTVAMSSVAVGSRVTTAPLVSGASLNLSVVVGDEDGEVVYIPLSLSPVTKRKISSERVNSIALVDSNSDSVRIVAATRSELHLIDGASDNLPVTSDGWEVVAGELRTGLPFIVASDRGGSEVLVYDGALVRMASMSYGSGISSIAIGDIDNDGLRDIVFASGEFLYALSPHGSMLENFPVHMSATVTSDPVIADLDGDGSLEILSSTADGLLFAVDRSGRTKGGFPLPLDGRNEFSPSVSLIPSAGNARPILVSATENGYVYAWQLSEISKGSAPPWSSYRGNVRHTGLENSPLTGGPVSSDFFPESRVYNWPNPVYDSKTTIRYFVGQDASVSVKIFDLTGDIVDEFPGPGVGGVDNEVEWDVSNIQSGIYLARIKATDGSKSASALIKIAVVK